MEIELGNRHRLQALLMFFLLIGCLSVSFFSTKNVCAQSPRQVWYPLDNGMDFGSLPLPSFLPESDQRAIIITSWSVGSLHDPPGTSGRTHLLAEVLRRSYRTPSSEGEIQVGGQRTWWIEKVPPKDVADHLNKIVDRFEFSLTDASLIGRVRGDLLADQKKQLTSLVPGLEDRVHDRLVPKKSGPRGRYQLGGINLQNLEEFRSETFTPVNIHIAIIGPHDPDPTLEIARKKLGKIAAGTPIAKVTPEPAQYGEIGVKKNLPGMSGAIVRSWRVPPPGTKESLALGILIPRIVRILDSDPSTVQWNPTIEPELITLIVPIPTEQTDIKTALLAAKARLDAAINFALQSSAEMSDMQYARKTFGGLLGISRVHDETSMYNPVPAAKALMVQRIHDVDERKLINIFGRDVESQMKSLGEEYLLPEKAVTGIVIPASVSPTKKP
ncbi:hypothetical protein CBD41_10005 [bacterium TMED181]|nr:hypothetical protein [Planctomycetota bacterium]OUW41836.1 MAG: hypothetical protein CBD41_10005 [bacterium TMED181]